MGTSAMSIAKLFFHNVQKNPKKTALIFNDNAISYGDLSKMVCQISANIKDAKNVHIAVLLENSIEFAALLISAAQTGAVLVPFPATMSSSQLEHLFKKNSIDFFIGDHSFKDIKKLEILERKPPLTDILNDDIDNNYIIVSTSGSTSEPKPIVLTQSIKLKRIEIACKTYGLDSSDTILVSTPMHHSLAQRGVLLGLTLGATVVLMDRFSPAKYLETIELTRATFSFSVSNQLESIVDFIDQYNVSSIKKMVSSSYAIKPEVKNRLLNYFDIHECYGTSEVGCVTELAPKDLNEHLESVGKPMDGIEIKILDPNEQGIGEIAVKSPWKFKEYYELLEITHESFEDGYFKTGDLGVLKDGFLYYTGRKKEMIKTGGISVYPMDIEKVIKEVDGVDEVAVIGIEDSYFGEAVIAVFTGTAKIADIRSVAKEKLLSYQQPLFYDRVDALPKNSLGKLQKFKLKEKYKNLDLGRRLKGLL
ncbi:class I adenylate-forming enzyme family protein [Hydrogenimonas thermophila]|nr:class I adenylate-forming enzyme family protein [Hydrogenimonas thermophila]